MTNKPTLEEAKQAVRTLIQWTGDNPDREGLVETPDRVVRAYQEFFSGYNDDPREVLGKTFEEIGGYDEMVMVRNIQLSSHCEHHMVPIVGVAHIAYLPNKRVVGLSKLVRVLEIYAKRLQVQETMTADVANTIFDVLQAKGVAVQIIAEHGCMTTRGVNKIGSETVTTTMLGDFKTDASLRDQFFISLK